MKHAQWLTATALLWNFGATTYAADNSGTYKTANMLTVPNGQIPVALAVNGNTVAVGFALNVTRLHRLTDAPVENTHVINAYASIVEEKPRTVAVKFFPDNNNNNNLCLVDRMGTIQYVRRPYNTVQIARGYSKSTFCMAVNKDIVCLGFDGDGVLALDHFGLLKKRWQGKASGHVNAMEIVDNCIVTGNYDGTVAVMDIEQGNEPVVLGNHGECNGIRNVLFCMAKQDSAIIYTSGSNYEIKIWDIRVKQPLACSFQHNSTYALAVLKPGYIAAGLNGNKVAIFDLRGVLRQPVEIVDAGNGVDADRNHNITALAAIDDGGFVSATSNGVVKVWK